MRPIVIVVVVAALLSGCLGGRTAADVVAEDTAYKAELAACELQASTCVGYVACRKRAAAGHGRTYNGRCVP